METVAVGVVWNELVLHVQGDGAVAKKVVRFSGALAD